MGGIRGLLIVALAVAAVLAQSVSADAKGRAKIRLRQGCTVVLRRKTF